MTFVNFKTSNNAIGTLSVGIGTSTTTAILSFGQGAKFPSAYPYLLTFEQLSGGDVIKREIVKVTNRTSDTFTIERSAGTCPPDDTTNAQGTTPFAFDAGSTVRLSPTAEIQQDVATELLRLEAEKADQADLESVEVPFGVSAVGTDAYQVTDSNTTAYVNGKSYKVQADVANDGTATLEINALGAKDLKKLQAGAFASLETGDIIADQIFTATFNADEDCFQFSSPATIASEPGPRTQSIFVSGENITAGNAVEVRSDGKVYKSDPAGGLGRFIGFAVETKNIDEDIPIATAGVAGGLTGLTAGVEYFLRRTGQFQLAEDGTGNVNTRIFYNTTDRTLGQGILLKYPTKKVGFWFRIQGTPASTNSVFDLQAFSNDTFATNIGTSSNNYNTNTFTTSFVYKEFTFATALPAGMAYFRFNRTSGSDSTSHYTVVQYGFNPYPDGIAYHFNSSNTKTDLTTLDLKFQTEYDSYIGEVADEGDIKVGTGVSATSIDLKANQDSKGGNIAFTFSLDSSGPITTTYSHNLKKKPQTILLMGSRIGAYHTMGSWSENGQNWTVSDGTNTSANHNHIRLPGSTSGAYYRGDVIAVDENILTIEWTRVSTPTGTFFGTFTFIT